MKDYLKVTSLQDYVLKEKNKNEQELKELGDKWVGAAAKNKLVYEIEWLGVPIIQTAEDMLMMQELIYREKPDVIVETGIAHGGSLIYYASLFEMLGKGKVIGIDIDIRDHNRKVIESHPMFHRIEMIQGDSLAEDNLYKIQEMIPVESKVMVLLDSNHYADHVYMEMKKYDRFVNKNSYMVVFDTHTDDIAQRGLADDSYVNNGPMTALRKFLAENDDYEIDKTYNKLYTSFSPDGYLKKIK